MGARLDLRRALVKSVVLQLRDDDDCRLWCVSFGDKLVVVLPCGRQVRAPAYVTWRLSSVGRIPMPFLYIPGGGDSYR